MIFKCKHPFNSLVVYKEHTCTMVDADFEHIDYHLYCMKCNKRLTLEYANLIGGVSEFLHRNQL